MDDPDGLRATDLVTGSGEINVAGRPLVVNLAPYAATEGDVWIVDRQAGLAIVGDLVVGLTPFMDTACPEGWRSALDAIAATEFTTLVPGHGEVMDKAAFLQWRSAFNNLLDCAASAKTKEECVAGWRRDAAAFIPAGDEKRVDSMIGYYLDSRLRAAPEERRRWCPKS
jgi:glyoxylase-like metal-dependent hydrolase (beta-lactamase superfamily II)